MQLSLEVRNGSQVNYPVLPVSVISRVVSNLPLGNLSLPAHAKSWQLLLQTVLSSVFCNFNCHGFKVFLTRLLLLK